MLISEVLEHLGRVNQLAGDIPIVLHDLESDVEHELKALQITLPAGASATGGATVSLVHGALSEPSTDPQSPEAA